MNDTTTLPHDILAEMSVLGSMILSSKAISIAAGNLNASAFYKIAHQRIFKSILKCSDDGISIDPIVLAAELKKDGTLEKIGGAAYLRELLESTPTAANVEMHVNITKEMAIRRTLIKKALKIQQAAHNTAADVDALTAELKDLHNTTIIQDKILRAGDFIDAADRRLAGDMSDFIPSGHSPSDDHYGGFEPGEYVVLSGFSGMGKTSFMNQTLLAGLVDGGVPVGVFSSEISGSRLIINLARTMSGEYISARRDGTMSAEAHKAWTEAKELIKSDLFNYYLNDTASIYIEDVHRLTRKMVDQYGVKIIGIDHLQRLRTRQNHQSEALRMKEISNRACEMARELNIVVLMLSQKTQGEGFQLRYATELFSDADKILDISQPTQMPIESEPAVCERTLAEKKGRDHGTAVFRGRFNKPGLRFDNWCRHYGG